VEELERAEESAGNISIPQTVQKSTAWESCWFGQIGMGMDELEIGWVCLDVGFDPAGFG